MSFSAAGSDEGAGADGLAVLISLIALSLFSLLALYLSLDATTAVRLSDNYESHARARAAARAGLDHARELLRGLLFDDLLRGPDGLYDPAPAGLAAARTFSYRNPVSWIEARTLDLDNPPGAAAGSSDDGILNTGYAAGAAGTVLIPPEGLALASAAGVSGAFVASRYFVKASDNNGDATELAGDPDDNPFLDGDARIIVRSLGTAGTIREAAGDVVRRNSVSVLEALFKRRTTFELFSAVAIQGTTVLPVGAGMFDGDRFLIQGGPAGFGVAVIDVHAGDGAGPANDVLAGIDSTQRGCIVGNGLTPSVGDITEFVAADSDKSLLFDSSFLSDFVDRAVPRFADSVYEGDQDWSGPDFPDLGTYDPALHPNSPGQNLKTILVTGNLTVSGLIQGGGLLVVGGRLTIRGPFRFNGLVLLIGAGELDASGCDGGITGGLYVARLTNAGIPGRDAPGLAVGGSCGIIMDAGAIKAGSSLIPPLQLSFREITTAMDP